MSEKGDIKILHFIGRIAGTGSVQMADMIGAFSKSTFSKIIIDFSKTSFINTVGISRLVDSCKKVKEANKRVAIVANGSIRQLFMDIYLNRLFQIADTVDSAIKNNSSDEDEEIVKMQ